MRQVKWLGANDQENTHTYTKKNDTATAATVLKENDASGLRISSATVSDWDISANARWTNRDVQQLHHPCCKKTQPVVSPCFIAVIAPMGWISIFQNVQGRGEFDIKQFFFGTRPMPCLFSTLDEQVFDHQHHPVPNHQYHHQQHLSVWPVKRCFFVLPRRNDFARAARNVHWNWHNKLRDVAPFPKRWAHFFSQCKNWFWRAAKWEPWMEFSGWRIVGGGRRAQTWISYSLVIVYRFESVDSLHFCPASSVFERPHANPAWFYPIQPNQCFLKWRCPIACHTQGLSDAQSPHRPAVSHPNKFKNPGNNEKPRSQMLQVRHIY